MIPRNRLCKFNPINYYHSYRTEDLVVYSPLNHYNQIFNKLENYFGFLPPENCLNLNGNES